MAVAWICACDRGATATPTSDAMLSAPLDADAEYPPTCSELGPATCNGPCSRGDAASCLHLAEGHLEGVGVARDPERAMELMRRACDEGLGRACGYLAGAIGRQKPAESIALMREGCELGYGGACVDYVGHHVLAATPPSWSAAAPWLRKGCERGHPHACLLWGDLQRTGSGTPVDVAGAAAAYRASCEAGSDVACGLVDGSDGPGPHAIIMPEPSVRDAAELRGSLSGLKGEYHPKVSMCTVWMGTIEIISIEGAPPGIEELIRRAIGRWRFTPAGPDEKRICTQLDLDFKMQ